jgi:membrane protease YdiL (CAAX protease family)
MFPKVEKMPKYRTGGFLREHVNITILVLLILNTIFLFLPGIPLSIIGFFLPEILGLPVVWQFFISFLIEVGFMMLLWQFIVPFGLKLPNGKQTFLQNSFSIGLSRVKPLWRNLIIGIGSFIIFGISAFLIGSMFGDYHFIPQILFTGYNWLFYFIYMLRPGIWEEIAFRGVLLNLQIRKYNKIVVIFLNGLLFGIYHFVNLLFGMPLSSTLIQVIFASQLGITLAYIFIKTNSLLPCIILHYLINAVGSIFQTFTFPNVIIEILFVIIGLGFLPMVLTIIFVFMITKYSSRNLK